MNVCVAIEHRMLRTPDGAVWTQMAFPYSFWTRYLEVFSQVTMLTRVQDVPTVPPEWIRADGDGVRCLGVPSYHGPWQYFRRRHEVKDFLRKAMATQTDAVILRIPTLQIAAELHPLLRENRRPYGAEIVADPFGYFSPGAIRHPLRPYFRWLYSRQQHQQVWDACAAAFVTEHALQRQFPANPHAYTTTYSSVELPDAALCVIPRVYARAPRPVTLITVATLGSLIKAPDVLIEAVGICRRAGVDVRLKYIGDGKHRAEMEKLVSTRGLGEAIEFLGQLTTGSAIFRQLDRADLFVLPSRSEALPRALIEAMARALPCICTRVGGNAEVLAEEELVPINDPIALAQAICAVVTDPARMTAMSARNLHTAARFRESVLRVRRSALYRAVMESTLEWQQQRRLIAVTA